MGKLSHRFCPQTQALNPTPNRHNKQTKPRHPPTKPDALRQVLRYSTRTSHPLFFNQLYARVEPAGIAAEWTSVATNTNVHTYEVAPVYTLLEHAVIAKMTGYVGYTANEADGLLVPGGSAANLYGMHIARHRAFPEVRTKGLAAAPPLVAFTSSHSHYSYTKAAAVTGLGTDNMVAVDTDEFGAMLPSALEDAIKAARAAGKTPFFVGLTAGTTVTGAFDPVAPVADICAREGVWLHVDGCWGAALLLSRKHRCVCVCRTKGGRRGRCRGAVQEATASMCVSRFHKKNLHPNGTPS
jgi:glutamate decarboxylase